MWQPVSSAGEIGHYSLSTQVTGEVLFLWWTLLFYSPVRPVVLFRLWLNTNSLPSKCKTTVQEGLSVEGMLPTATVWMRLCWLTLTLDWLTSSFEGSLSKIPSSLALQEKTLTLMAVIAFQRGLTQDAVGQYVASCRRTACVWELDHHLDSSVTAASDNTKICPHAVFHTGLASLSHYHYDDVTFCTFYAHN